MEKNFKLDELYESYINFNILNKELNVKSKSEKLTLLKKELYKNLCENVDVTTSFFKDPYKLINLNSLASKILKEFKIDKLKESIEDTMSKIEAGKFYFVLPKDFLNSLKSKFHIKNDNISSENELNFKTLDEAYNAYIERFQDLSTNDVYSKFSNEVIDLLHKYNDDDFLKNLTKNEKTTADFFENPNNLIMVNSFIIPTQKIMKSKIIQNALNKSLLLINNGKYNGKLSNAYIKDLQKNVSSCLKYLD